LPQSGSFSRSCSHRVIRRPSARALPDSEVNYTDNSESFLRLLPEMGLKLERTKGPVDTLVIDHAETPSPN